MPPCGITETLSDVESVGAVHIDTGGGLLYAENGDFAGEEELTYGNEFKPKTVSMEGYEFRGWLLISPDSEHWEDHPGLSVILQTNNRDLMPYLYVTKICKDNRCDLTLQAAFGYGGYSVYVDNNGGKYDGEYEHESSRMLTYGLLAQDISGILNDYSREVYREGYTLQCLSTTKDTKGKLDLSQPVKDIGKKNKYGSYTVTIYPIWKKLNPATPTVTGAYTVTNGAVTTLKMETNIGAYPGFSQVLFEYSPTPTFLYGVKTAVALPEDYEIPENPVTINNAEVTVAAGKEYYVRARYGMIDSTGKPYYGPYSKVVRVSKPAQ